MHEAVGGKGHGANLDLIDGFEENAALPLRRHGADGGEVEVLARFGHIADNQPVSGNDVVVPGQLSLVRVAVVTGVAEDLLYFRRRLEVCGYGRVGQSGADELKAEKNERGQPKENPEARPGCFSVRHAGKETQVSVSWTRNHGFRLMDSAIYPRFHSAPGHGKAKTKRLVKQWCSAAQALHLKFKAWRIPAGT